MIWRAIFIFGGLLILVTLLTGVFRFSSVDDSGSLAVATSSSSGNRIVRVDLNGDQTPLFNLPLRTRLLRYEWSPDGAWLLVSIYYFRGSNISEIYLVHRTGLEVKLIKQVAQLAWGARFAPDGQQIAFITADRRHSQINFTQTQEVIQVVRLDLAGRELGRYEIASFIEQPSEWTLTWLANDTLEITEAPENNIHQIDIATHTVTTTHLEVNDPDFHYRFVRLSPNREWYIQHSRQAKLERFPALTDADSVTLLTLDNADIQYAAWSEDSAWLALWVYPAEDESPPPHSAIIYLVRPDGADLRQLTEPQTHTSILPLVHETSAQLQNEQRPFSPQNHWLVYAVQDQTNEQTYLEVRRTDGSGQATRHLLANKVAGYSFQWAPYIPHQFNMVALFLGGLLAVAVGGGWQFSQRRQET